MVTCSCLNKKGKDDFIMKKLLCASMMCAHFGNLEEEIKLLEKSGIDIFHLDIMDGIFVPNFGMGLQDVEYICQHANIPCDVHLMISHPYNYIFIQNLINMLAEHFKKSKILGL